MIVLLFGLIYYKLEISHPRRYLHLQDEAAVWNTENWENGHALRVTVQVSSDEALGAKTATATVGCYEKQFARAGGLKGPPAIYTKIISEGPKF